MMPPVFIYQQWLDNRLRSFIATQHRPPEIKNRPIIMTPQQYGAALMQAYLGQASPAWIAAVSGVPLKRLMAWRRKTRFLLVMDWSKSNFRKAFREAITLKDYLVPQYHYIAAEFAWLEESLRVSTRVSLFTVYLTLTERLMSQHKHQLKMRAYDVHLFVRLFLLFWALEHHWPTSLKHRIENEILPFVKQEIWPQFESTHGSLNEMAAVQTAADDAHVRSLLEAKLRTTFKQVQ